ncbi:hypothetical protein GCM10020254_15990 [Streptomyces goshikiensis]
MGSSIKLGKANLSTIFAEPRAVTAAGYRRPPPGHRADRHRAPGGAAQQGHAAASRGTRRPEAPPRRPSPAPLDMAETPTTTRLRARAAEPAVRPTPGTPPAA